LNLMSKHRVPCVDCSTPCTGERCKRCSNRHKAVQGAPAHNIDLSTLSVDYVQFTARDDSGVCLPIKMKFKHVCERCRRTYVTALVNERAKKHPWHCKSCAIALEWDEPDYRGVHERALKAAHSAPDARVRHSAQSKTNWANPDVRARMLDKDHVAIAAKGLLTKMMNLLSGKTTYRVTHGKRTLVGSTWMRSTYEARFARALDARGIAWCYEPKWFSVAEGRAYLPDFYVPSLDVYVEIKGWWRDDARMKFDAFVANHPNVRYALITRSELESIERQEVTLEACIIEARR
jgi:hypothetical protein